MSAPSLRDLRSASPQENVGTFSTVVEEGHLQHVRCEIRDGEAFFISEREPAAPCGRVYYALHHGN